MASHTSEFVEILLQRSLVSPDQVTEADQYSRSNDVTLGEALVKLDYATSSDVCRAMAEYHNLDFVNLDEIKIQENIEFFFSEVLYPKVTEHPLWINDSRICLNRNSITQDLTNEYLMLSLRVA